MSMDRWIKNSVDDRQNSYHEECMAVVQGLVNKGNNNNTGMVFGEKLASE